MRALIIESGDRIEVGISGRFDEQRTVRPDSPESLDITPDEARRVAVVLIEQAAQAERHNRQRKESL